MAHITDDPEGTGCGSECKCSTRAYAGTGGGGGEFAVSGLSVNPGTVMTAFPWASGGYYYPSYSYTSGHAPKCENCGYCPCCGKADVPGRRSE